MMRKSKRKSLSRVTRGSGVPKFGKKLEMPPLEEAEKWLPRRGEEKIFKIKKILQSKFGGKSYLVSVYDDETEEYFLPSHAYLRRPLENAEVKEGHVIKVRCLKVGRETGTRVQKTWEYEVWAARDNAPF